MEPTLVELPIERPEKFAFTINLNNQGARPDLAAHASLRELMRCLHFATVHASKFGTFFPVDASCEGRSTSKAGGRRLAWGWVRPTLRGSRNLRR
jgi:hypothetical protein